MRVVLLALMLSGCVTTGPYWVKVADPVPHMGTVVVAEPCGRRDLDGCTRRATGVIELRAGMDYVLQDCVLKHELRHLAGYDHPIGTHYATDCGDGTLVSARQK